LILDLVAQHGIVPTAGENHPRAHRAERRRAAARHVGIVVVVNVVLAEDRARVGAGGPLAVVRARPVLRRGGVVVVLAVGGDAAGVVVPLRLLDDEMTAGVGPGVAERRVLGVRVGEPRVAVGTSA